MASPGGPSNGPAYVYRLFDAEGTLLYVGLTETTARIDQHVQGRTWGPTVVTVTMTRFATRVDAALAERAAIEAESPRENRVVPPLPGSRRTKPEPAVRREATAKPARRFVPRGRSDAPGWPIWVYLDREGIKLTWLARRIGYSSSHVYNVKAGAWALTAHFRAKCSGILGIPEGDLFPAETAD